VEVQELTAEAWLVCYRCSRSKRFLVSLGHDPPLPLANDPFDNSTKEDYGYG
jgi:hypothetical protein